eukprot:10429803-Karenia_brevis.AAC.1
MLMSTFAGGAAADVNPENAVTKWDMIVAIPKALDQIGGAGPSCLTLATVVTQTLMTYIG